MTSVIVNGQTVDFDGAVQLMDDDLREQLHSALGSNDPTEQEFIDMYAVAHAKRFDETFAVN